MPEPTACLIDAQSIKTSTNVPATEQGIDAHKKIVDRKRGIVIDTTGLLLTVLVSAASMQDSTAGEVLLDRIAVTHPTIRKDGRTAATANTSSTTRPVSASTSKSSAAPQTPAAFPCSRAGGR